VLQVGISKNIKIRYSLSLFTMRFSIIASEKDIAGMNIVSVLKEKYSDEVKKNNAALHIIKEDTIFFEGADKLDADYLIFATRHQSKSGEKTLSVHFPGNFSKAEFGGVDKSLCTSAVSLLKQAFINLNEIGKDSGYSITMEATHHGPLLKKPVIFIEIGSREEQWKDKKAAEIIAKTIIKTLTEYKKTDYETAIGFGGLHYCQNFNEIELSKNIALSHICPKYHVGVIDEEVILRMFNASDSKVSYALLDWKGIQSEDKQRLVAMLERLNIPWKKTKGI
jgi:D-aminoacyl-tRNA deacylase